MSAASQQSLSDVRERLLARQRELNARSARLRADQRRENDPLSSDAPDRAVQEQNDEVVDDIAAAVEAEQIAIQAALGRVDAGRYGICSTCGERISEKRLDAIPCAEQCQSCAAQANS